ncbi:uncharacterized protein LOC109793751 [Cajanus cajan]|uniref:uncharacterized protein LOC109793751 n=1 Tax=Cajanus cajan TaxID=3821 RepID=UPI00098D791F|nr:uncharacterized protein LOC109793751 [Cajanus cajan]
MTGAFAHGAIFFIRDYNPEQNEDNVLARILDHKEAIISHLSWASLFLGFHTLGLYVHNDVMLAFGTPEKQILIEPIFAQWIQSAHGKTSYGFDVLLSSTNSPAFNAGRSIWLPGWLNAVNENSNSLFLTIGPGDFLVHHAIALGLHTTTLILVKGALDARGSKLMPDKKDFGYSFPCDGPGRGGTCDISAWDAFYLAVFWMLNTIGWVTFYWHWKHITLWQGNVSQFNESSTYLMGWLRDYLWLNSSQLINGYNHFGMNNLLVENLIHQLLFPYLEVVQLVNWARPLIMGIGPRVEIGDFHVGDVSHGGGILLAWLAGRGDLQTLGIALSSFLLIRFDGDDFTVTSWELHSEVWRGHHYSKLIQRGSPNDDVIGGVGFHNEVSDHDSPCVRRDSEGG